MLWQGERQGGGGSLAGSFDKNYTPQAIISYQFMYLFRLAKTGVQVDTIDNQMSI